MTNSEWQPIETAPRDGTAIWLLADNQPFIGYFDPPSPWSPPKDRWVLKAYFLRRDPSRDGLTDEIFGCYATAAPTHWMPLPPPPASGRAVRNQAMTSHEETSALADRLQALQNELRWLAAFAEVRSKDDSKTFARVNRGALRTIRDRALAAIARAEGRQQ